MGQLIYDLGNKQWDIPRLRELLERIHPMKKSLLLFISFIVLLTAPLLHAAKTVEQSEPEIARQEILILNSYHPGYAFSDDEQAGVIDVFREKDKNWIPVIEYLYLKRLPDGRHLAELKKLFRLKYQNKKFSVVIAMDNPALEFAIDNQADLFGNAPIVFCGINNYTPSLLKGRSDVTGIVEAIDIAGTIEVMLRLHPATQEIFSPNDYTATGLAMRKELEALVPRFAKVRFRFTDPLTMEELLKELEGLPKDSLVLQIGFITDKSGRAFDISETTELFYEHSPVPIYSTYEQRLGFGIVGGKLLSPRIHGANAARIALRVLAGEKASAIPVVFESDSQFMFDYKVMSRFGIPLSALPENSTVINKPVSFYAAHRVVIQTASGIVVFLAVVISLLTINIIQRRRSSEVIRRSEERFRRVTESLQEAVWSADLSGQFDFLSPAMAHIYGRPISEMKVNPDFWIEATYPEDQAAVHASKETLIRDQRVELEYRIILPDDTVRWVADRKLFLLNEHGEPSRIAGILSDITERKRAEEALSRSEENFRRSLDDSPMGVRIVTKKGETVYANREILNIYGYDSMEALDSTPVKNRYTPESYADYLIRREKRQQGIDVPPEYEISIVRKDGEVRHLQVFRKEILWDGERQFQVLYNDITERKKAEEALGESELRYKELFDNISSGVAIYDVKDNGNDFVLKDFNKAGEQLDGDRKEDIVGKSIYQIRPGIKEFGLLDVFKRVWETGIPEHYPAQFYEDERLKKWFENYVYKLPTGEIVAVYDDITDRKQAEEKLRASQQQLRALAERLQQIREEERVLIAREIHDVMGGGLTGLKMDLNWLMHNVKKTESYKEHDELMSRFLSINENIDHMIKETRRISTGLRPPFIDDLGLISAIDWQLSEFTGRTGILHELTTQFEHVNMEKDKAVGVFRIFQEMLINVIRHSRATKVVVFLREDERDLFGDENLVLEVRDNGRGITDDEILDKKSLGLLGMKERAMVFGGEFSIRGEPGGGTTVVLKIPRKKGEQS
ncbi:MAG: hypothetical protein BWK74_04465 [Desulfobacteraceae bacterium A6]|nr:MAG: hypothetical protein BWK74_04465 [Desulfobacteraceae bacterium A6]